MFKHIVVGCDGSQEGRDAVALGARIASVTDARLSLVGVFPTSFFPVAGITDRKTLRAQATRALRHDRDLLAPHALVHAVADNSVPRALRHYAERWHADLVIVGSNPTASPGHVAIGRRARQLLYDAPFALGLAARGLHERTRWLRTIGVGYDGEPEAESALALAAELARSAGARLAVRRVVEDSITPLDIPSVGLMENWNDVLEEERQAGTIEAEAATSRLGISAEVTVTVGDPGYEVRAFSETVDLVVVGSRRWGPVARLVTGGVGETLVKDASSSILIAPRPVRRGSALKRPRERKPAVA